MWGKILREADNTFNEQKLKRRRKTIIQLMAFALGIDGQVFAATLSVISALIGYILGIKIESNKATEIIDLITSNIKTNLEEIRKKLL